jgi:hypothetical protein
LNSSIVTLSALTLLCISASLTAQVNYPGGRIAVSCDGNHHDRDDIAATALSLGMLAHAGLQKHLNYYGHSDHIWDNTKEQMDEMVISAEGTAELFGGFDLSVIHNAKKETTASIMALTDVINASSGKDKLWLIAAGPMEVVGKAIQYSDPGKRKFVTVISHSNWNNNHAAKDHGGYSFESLKELGVDLIRITDQNSGTNRPYEEYHWLRDSKDKRLNWLWERGVTAGKKNFDPSDSGMVYWLITGGPEGGDKNANPEKIREFFRLSLPPG